MDNVTDTHMCDIDKKNRRFPAGNWDRRCNRIDKIGLYV